MGESGRRPDVLHWCHHVSLSELSLPDVEESVMKLPLIVASVVTYTVLALAWIVYAGLTPPNALF